jgi:hypothetical protein
MAESGDGHHVMGVNTNKWLALKLNLFKPSNPWSSPSGWMAMTRDVPPQPLLFNTRLRPYVIWRTIPCVSPTLGWTLQTTPVSVRDVWVFQKQLD